jgi:hypothetical protein
MQKSKFHELKNTAIDKLFLNEISKAEYDSAIVIAIFQTTVRQFRYKQKDFSDLADKGEK